MQLLQPTYKELQEIKSAEKKKLLCWNEKRDQTILNMIQVLSFFSDAGLKQVHCIVMD